MNGIELLKIVRSFNKTMKVIVISGQALAFRNSPIIGDLGVFAVLDKPIDFLELESLIEEALA